MLDSPLQNQCYWALRQPPAPPGRPAGWSRAAPRGHPSILVLGIRDPSNCQKLEIQNFTYFENPDMKISKTLLTYIRLS